MIRCSGSEDGLYSDGSDCSAMFWCVDGAKLSLRCPSPGQTFDTATASCSFYAAHNCRKGVSQRVGRQLSTPRHILGQDPTVLPSPYYFVPAQTSVLSHDGARLQLEALRAQAASHGYPVPLQVQTYLDDYDRDDKKNVVCYFANWAGNRGGDGTFVPENLDASLCSHVVYAFAGLDTATLELASTAPRTDIESGYFNRVQTMARRANRKVKVLLAIGGWTDSGTTAYSRLVTDRENIDNFVRKAVEYIKVELC